MAASAPVRVHGEVRVPGDKSVSHRALIFAALADGASALRGARFRRRAGHRRRAARLGVAMPPIPPRSSDT